VRNVLGFSREILSRQDWIYLLSLLIPFVVYNLAQKVASVLAQSGERGFVRTLDLMQSDIFFNLGYVLLWIGLFMVARRGLSRQVVIVFFHVATILVLLVNTCSHQYFRQNGTSLDYGTIAEWLPKFSEIVPILVYDVPLLAWVLLAAALLYAAFGPLLVTRAVGWWQGGQESSPARMPGNVFSGSLKLRLFPLGLFALALGFGLLSLLAGASTLARDPVVNVVLTGAKEATNGKYNVNAGAAVEHPAAHASLAQTPQTEKRNVVLVHLESTRAQSVTPYNKDLQTMPFLDELSRESLLAERAYVTVPRSSKASVAVNCGIEPPLYPGPEFEPNGIPVPCLAELLKEQDYSTVFFASTSNAMDNFGDVARGFGYEEIYSSEVMDREGFEVTNTFGYEEAIMLEPSREWLANHGRDKPFLVEYFTGTGHYGYECMNTRYGTENFSEDEELNRYHNCLRYLDIFLENLFDQYKELGLYEDTIFVIFGDHGEGFGEHGRSLHGDTIYEEGLRIPLIIHTPGQFEGGERVEGLSNQIDILPTVLEMLGYEVKNGKYPGYSLLQPLPGSRTLMFSCITNRKCLASLKSYEKYIHHYGDQPDEVFDLSRDPLEKQNLADERDEQELDERREELLAWYSSVNAMYGGE
jgi:phosphoglycerol transferase MdoB-like AlkP superfamily enzyme